MQTPLTRDWRKSVCVILVLVHAAVWLATIAHVFSVGSAPKTSCQLLPTNSVSLFMSISPQCPLIAGDRITYIEIDGHWKHTRDRLGLLSALPPEAEKIVARLDGSSLGRTTELRVHTPGPAAMLGRVGLALVLSTALLVLAARIVWVSDSTQHYSIAVLAWSFSAAITPVIVDGQLVLLDAMWLVSTTMMAPSLIHVCGYLRASHRETEQSWNPLGVYYGLAFVLAVLRADAGIRGQAYFLVLDSLSTGFVAAALGVVIIRCLSALKPTQSPIQRERAGFIFQGLGIVVVPLVLLRFIWPDAPHGDASIFEAALIVSSGGIGLVGQRIWQREAGRRSELASNFSLACLIAGVPALALIAGEFMFDREPYGGSTGLFWLYVWAAVFLLGATVRRVFADAPTRAYIEMMQLDSYLSGRLSELHTVPEVASTFIEGFRTHLRPSTVSILLRGDDDRYRFVGDELPDPDRVGKAGTRIVADESIAELWSEKLLQDPESAHLRRLGFSIASSLEHRGCYLGVVLLGSPKGRETLRPYQLRHIEAQCRRVAIAMHNAVLVDEARASALKAAKAASAVYLAHDVQGPLISLKRRLESPSFRAVSSDFAAQEIDGLHSIASEALDRFRDFFRRRQDDNIAPLEDVMALAVELVGDRDVVVRPTQGLPRVARVPELTRLLENLLRNAVEATIGAIAPEIYARRRNGGTIVDVQDRGTGLPRLPDFELFREGVSTKGAGRGLGLSACASIARELGWSLELIRREKGGTIARLVLPDDSNGIMS